MVSVLDGHSHGLAFLGGALGVPQIPLGVDHFGQSGSRGDLYRHYGVDADRDRRRREPFACPRIASGLTFRPSSVPPHALQRRSPPHDDTRLKSLAEQLDAGVIARREFLRQAAVITGGTAAGLHVLRPMAHAQAGTKMRVWLFKSFVTACNDILAKQIEAWAQGAQGRGRDRLGHLRRPRAEVRGGDRGREPARRGRDELPGARCATGRRCATSPKLAKDIAGARGGLLPYAERVVQFGGQYFGVARQTFGRRAAHPQGPPRRQGPQDAQGLRPRRDRDGQEVPGPRQGPLGLRPDPEPLRRRQRLHAEHPLGLRRQRLGQGRQAGPRRRRS